MSFTLYDVRGKLIATEYNRNSFDVSGLQSGMYLLRANDGASLRLIIE
ncbi:MAG: T9SS type A sorting domain-containing protein [bacterium]